MARSVLKPVRQSELGVNQVASAEQDKLPEELDRLECGAFKVEADPVEVPALEDRHFPSGEHESGSKEYAFFKLNTIDVEPLGAERLSFDRSHRTLSGGIPDIDITAALEAYWPKPVSATLTVQL